MPKTLNPRPWVILAVVTAGFIAVSLNWFSIAVALTPIGEDLRVGTSELALLVSVFLVGAGLFQIPAGMLATRYGLRATVSLGLAFQGVAALLTLVAQDYVTLLVLRFLAGVGTAVFIPLGVAAVSVWYRRGSLAFALGILSAGYSIGAALGFYTWADLTTSLGWREAMALGGAIALVVAAAIGVFYRSPSDAGELSGSKVSLVALKQTLGNVQLWLYGIAFAGAYGAYFAASNLFYDYGLTERELTYGQIGFAALLLGLAGIPGSILGGLLSDRVGKRKVFVLGMIILQGVGLLALPVVPAELLWVAAAVLGFAFNGGWAVWQCVPGETRGVDAESIGTALGLMLTITAAGGFLVPYLFGRILEASGYTTGWIFLGVVTLGCCVAGILAREPEGVPVPSGSADTPAKV